MVLLPQVDVRGEVRLATTRLTETWIHAGDVLHAFGQVPAATERLWHIARLAWRTLPYAFARDGLERASRKTRFASGMGWPMKNTP